ncbi:MAG: ABC transporter substrate-binding protein [Bacteroidota bacterium]
MKQVLKPLLFLLTVASILLVTDLPNRKGKWVEDDIKRVAIFKFNSNLILEEAEAGVISGLENQTLFPKNQLEITRYCPQGDMPIGNTTALEIVSKKFDLVISISTPGLQVMANANKNGAIKHLFCCVTDPIAAGVGITGPGKDQHPPWLAGIGTFQPVEKAFRLAREMKPDLKKVGVVWCIGETCSEACIRKARVICDELGIELLETGIETASQVYEAAIALTTRGVEALWIGGDNVVETAIDMYINAGLKAGIPVFNNSPYTVIGNVAFGVGANYKDVGRMTGEMACEVLNGKPVTHIEIADVVPEMIYINETILGKVKGNWTIPESVRARADSIIRR